MVVKCKRDVGDVGKAKDMGSIPITVEKNSKEDRVVVVDTYIAKKIGWRKVPVRKKRDSKGGKKGVYDNVIKLFKGKEQDGGPSSLVGKNHEVGSANNEILPEVGADKNSNLPEEEAIPKWLQYVMLICPK